MIQWHTKTPEEAAHLTGSDLYTGLSQKEAALRGKEGKNILFPRRKKTTFDFCRPILLSFMPPLLLISGVAAFLVGRRPAGYVLLFTLFFHLFFLLFAFLRARRVADGVEEASEPAVKLIREGKLFVTSSDNLVQGDVILLSRGDRIPADCLLISADRLVVRESGITQRGLTEKDPDFPGGKDPQEASNMLWAGSAVEEGSCRALVCEIGGATYLARTKEKVLEEDFEKTPLVLLLKKLSGIFSGILLGLLFLSAVVGFLPFTPLDFIDSWLLGCAFAASALSEFYAVFAYIALGNAVFGALSYSREGLRLRKNSRLAEGTLIKRLGGLDRIARSDRLLLPFSLLTVPAASTLSALIDPFGKTISAEGELPLWGRQVLRNGALACGETGGFAFRAGQIAAGRQESDEKKVLLYEALSRCGLLAGQKEERDRLAASGRTAEGISYGFLQRGEDSFVVLAGRRERILPHCSHGLAEGRLERLNPARVEALSHPSDNLSEYWAVAIGVVDRTVLQRAPFASEAELFDSLPDRLVLEGLLVFETALQKELSVFLAAAKEARVGITLFCDKNEELALAASLGFTLLKSPQDELTPRSALMTPTLPERLALIEALQEKGEHVVYTGREFAEIPLLKKADVAATCGSVVAGGAMVEVSAGRKKASSKGMSAEKERRLLADTACDALRGAADLVVAPGTGRGRGGFCSLTDSLLRAKAVYCNMNALMRYLFTVNAAKGLLTAASLFSGISFVTPVFLVLMGLGYDLIAVMVMALRLPDNRQLARREDEGRLVSLLGPSLILGFVSAAAILLPALLSHRLFDASAELFVTIALLLFSLTTLLFCRPRVKQEGPRRRTLLPGAGMILATLLIAAILFFTAADAAFSLAALLMLLVSLVLVFAFQLALSFFLRKKKKL